MPRALALCLAAVATLVSAAAAWLYLAPPQLGGGTSYAVVYGTSMEPHFHRGDLVVLRRRASYHVGEIVGYHSRQLHRDVLHRIVGVHGGIYAFKGDNNGFVDPEHVRASQLFGEEWVRVPGAGAQLQRLRSPRVAALVAGLAALLLLGGGGATARRRRPRPAAAAPVRARPSLPAFPWAAIAVGALALSVALPVALVAFTRPAERTLVSPDLYVKHGVFAYTATAPVGAVYRDPVVRAPAPVYLKLVHRLDVSFAYSTKTRSAAALAGRGRLDAVLGDGAGWSRTFPLEADTTFDGMRATLRGHIDLAALGALIKRFEAQTGEHNTLYKLELRPLVALRGTVGGKTVKDVFAPSLMLDLDQLRLQPEHPADGDPPNTLVRAESAAGSHRQAATLAAFGLHPTISQVRDGSLLAAACGLGLVLLGGLPLLLGRRGEELASIRRRYGDSLVEIAPGERPSGVERRVATMEALARIADRYERLILHESRDGRDSFLVEDDGVVYRHDVVRLPEASEEPVPPVPEEETTLFGWTPAQRTRPLAKDWR